MVQTFELVFAAPIPVGHRVELMWYQTKVEGLLSGTRFESRPHAPVARDLDTGVIYAPVDLFWARGSIAQVPRNSQPFPLQWEPLTDQKMEYQLVGKVIACRVATYEGVQGEHYKVQTTLVVETDS